MPCVTSIANLGLRGRWLQFPRETRHGRSNTPWKAAPVVIGRGRRVSPVCNGPWRFNASMVQGQMLAYKFGHSLHKMRL